MGKAASGDTVRVHYTGLLTDGETFDSSKGRTPLELTLGASQVIPGFEKAILGMEEGETRSTTIPAAQAYGEPKEELRFGVDRSQLPDGVEPEVGLQLAVRQPDGQAVSVRIADVGEETVILDANHPLAGLDLTFELELVEIVAG